VAEIATVSSNLTPTASWKIGKYREEFSVFFLAKYRKI